jgi:D-threonine aldolase
MTSPTTETKARTDWYKVTNVDQVPSPALLVYPDRVDENIRRMIEIAGGVERLRPHMKTNKLLDLDCGMHRTGVAPGPQAVERYRLLSASPGLRAAGLHVYDGHIRDSDIVARTASCDAAFAQLAGLRDQLVGTGLPVPLIVAGGTPTFPIHARRAGVQCSPGTSVFWDLGYETLLPDLDFTPAVLVLTRVISKPSPNILCLDLGHKAIASESPHPRVELLGLPDARAIGHSEEHLTIDTPRADEFPVGSVLYGVPWHICPTVALHQEAVVIRNGRAEERWQVVGRARTITV